MEERDDEEKFDTTNDGSPKAESLFGRENVPNTTKETGEHDSLKYHLLGPSLTKAGQDSVDQQKVQLYL
jgi:hypothetical protein